MVESVKISTTLVRAVLAPPATTRAITSWLALELRMAPQADRARAVGIGVRLAQLFALENVDKNSVESIEI